MAENDRFEKSFKPGWVKPYRLLLIPDVGDTEIVDAIITPLTKILRDEDIPGRQEMNHTVSEAVWRLNMDPDPTGQANALVKIFDALDDIVRIAEGHRHTKIAAEVAKSMIIENDVGDTAGSFDERVCSAFVEHYFFAIARANLVSKGVASTQSEAKERQRRIEHMLRPQLKKLVEKLSNVSDVRTLRAPNRLTPMEPTRSLLDQDLLAA